MNALVEYIPKSSFFHKLNPITKILWTFIVFFLSFLTDSPVFILSVLLTSLILSAFSGIFKNVMPVIKGLFVFSSLLILFQIFFVTEGLTLCYVLPWFKTGRITDRGLALSIVMALRMLTTVSTIPILMMTTPMTDIIVVMVENLKIPFKYTFIFVTALRFIPTFMDEMDHILQAQMSRGYKSDTKNPVQKLIIIIPLAIPLLVSSIKKSERMAVSMEVRGFGCGKRSHYREIRMKATDYCTISVFITTIVASIIFFR